MAQEENQVLRRELEASHREAEVLGAENARLASVVTQTSAENSRLASAASHTSEVISRVKSEMAEVRAKLEAFR